MSVEQIAALINIGLTPSVSSIETFSSVTTVPLNVSTQEAASVVTAELNYKKYKNLNQEDKLLLIEKEIEQERMKAGIPLTELIDLKN